MRGRMKKWKQNENVNLEKRKKLIKERKNKKKKKKKTTPKNQKRMKRKENVVFWPFDPAKNAIQGDAPEGSDTF